MNLCILNFVCLFFFVLFNVNIVLLLELCLICPEFYEYPLCIKLFTTTVDDDTPVLLFWGCCCNIWDCPLLVIFELKFLFLLINWKYFSKDYLKKSKKQSEMLTLHPPALLGECIPFCPGTASICTILHLFPGPVQSRLDSQFFLLPPIHTYVEWVKHGYKLRCIYCTKAKTRLAN